MLAAVGRAVPPQPLREVSSSMPSEVGKPAPTNRLHMSAANEASSIIGLYS